MSKTRAPSPLACGRSSLERICRVDLSCELNACREQTNLPDGRQRQRAGLLFVTTCSVGP